MGFGEGGGEKGERGQAVDEVGFRMRQMCGKETSGVFFCVRGDVPLRQEARSVGEAWMEWGWGDVWILMVVWVWQEPVNRVVDGATLDGEDAVRAEDTVPEIYRRPGYHLFEQCEIESDIPLAAVCCNAVCCMLCVLFCVWG